MYTATLQSIRDENTVAWITVLFENGQRSFTKDLKLVNYNYSSISDIHELVRQEIEALDRFENIVEELGSLIGQELGNTNT